MSKLNSVISVVLITAGIVYAATISWVALLSQFLIVAVMASLFLSARKQGSNIFINIAYGAIICFILLWIISGAYTSISSIPAYLELSKTEFIELILTAVNNLIPCLLILLGNVAPFIYCLSSKKQK